MYHSLPFCLTFLNIFPQFASRIPSFSVLLLLLHRLLFLRLFLILFICLVFSSIFKDAISYHVFEDITISSLFELFISLKSLCFFQIAFYVYWFCTLSSMLEAFLRCLGICNGFFLFNDGT